TDTCIPEDKAFRAIEKEILQLWQRADENNQRFFPHEYFYQIINEGLVKQRCQIDPKDSWLVAAAEANLPLFVPGWEDSTLGNIFVGHVLEGDLSGFHLVKSGTEYMGALAKWYVQTTMGKALNELQPVEGEDSEEAVHMRAIDR